MLEHQINIGLIHKIWVTPTMTHKSEPSKSVHALVTKEMCITKRKVMKF